MYVFEVVEGEHTGYLIADSRDEMLRVGVWLNERADITGLKAHIYHSDRPFIPTPAQGLDEEDMEDFSEFLADQFNDFRAALH